MAANALLISQAEVGDEADVTALADMAVAALIDEATLTPKPGLVDLRGGGAHRDMDWLLLCHSARTLLPTFAAMAEAGKTIADATALRARIGKIGRDGEAAMLAATHGVNTHRGAIWALGLLVTATAQSEGDAESIACRAGALARLPDPFAPVRTGNKGEAACERYQVDGARGEAQANFPHVIDLALPFLRNARHQGADELSARLNCLLALMASLDDTCVLVRGGRAALDGVRAGAARVLALGGAASSAGRQALHQLETWMVSQKVSPGGAADLLAAALFLDRITQETDIARK